MGFHILFQFVLFISKYSFLFLLFIRFSFNSFSIFPLDIFVNQNFRCFIFIFLFLLFLCKSFLIGLLLLQKPLSFPFFLLSFPCLL